MDEETKDNVLTCQWTSANALREFKVECPRYKGLMINLSHRVRDLKGTEYFVFEQVSFVIFRERGLDVPEWHFGNLVEPEIEVNEVNIGTIFHLN